MDKGDFESDAMSFILNVLEKYLPGVVIDHESIVSFHRDWVKRLGKSGKSRYMAMPNVAKRLSSLYPRLNSSVERLEREMLTSFLLNSDFNFSSPADATKYLGRHEPICNYANPFARFI